MFELTIITTTASRVLQVVSLEVETTMGNCVILKGHVPLIAILQPHKEIRFEGVNGLVESMELPGGIVEVRRDATLIIVN